MSQISFSPANIVLEMGGLRRMYNKYRPYIRVDLIMYAVLLLIIILYVILELVFS